MLWGREERWDPQWDSTWEEEEEEEGEIPESDLKGNSRRGASRSARAARDLQNYRHGYPGKDRDSEYMEFMPNLEFYQNRIPFQPYGDDIDTMLSDWRGDYVRLEENHSYIQWLFPLREEGVNPYAAPLTLREIEALKGDKDAMRRFREAYRLMLDFYGIELRDEDSGEVARAPNYKERFSNLNRRGHNNLRITRILKCLGELGYGRFQAPLVRFFLEETLVHKELPNVRHSALDYFMFTVRDREQRKELVLFAWEHFPHREGFIWGPRNYFQYRAAKNAESSADQEITQENSETPGEGEGNCGNSGRGSVNDGQKDAGGAEGGRRGELERKGAAEGEGTSRDPSVGSVWTEGNIGAENMENGAAGSFGGVDDGKELKLEIKPSRAGGAGDGDKGKELEEDRRGEDTEAEGAGGAGDGDQGKELEENRREEGEEAGGAGVRNYRDSNPGLCAELRVHMLTEPQGQEVLVMEIKEKSCKRTEGKRIQRLGEQEVQVMEIKEKSWKSTEGKRVRRLGEQEVQVMETKEKSWKSTEEKRVQRLREQEVLVMEIKEKSWKRQKGRGYRG
ncbi:opioid growth factor receptor-like protein 1 [Xenopus tropicalis]|uniref:Opioid growth factor receptor-like protein 1 n=1 Tax=Xenopus tropicalis TaxID=8364 RepID=A0A8J1J141_XENTR|nr:opioid growth factor receptor-like protein 1 [Xenopus tropicalis]